MTYYLDTDTTPPIRSQYAYCGLKRAIARAFDKLSRVDEGQIGIYENHIGVGFKGYAIKYPDSAPYFEPNLDEEAA